MEKKKRNLTSVAVTVKAPSLNEDLKDKLSDGSLNSDRSDKNFDSSAARVDEEMKDNEKKKKKTIKRMGTR